MNLHNAGVNYAYVSIDSTIKNRNKEVKSCFGNVKISFHYTRDLVLIIPCVELFPSICNGLISFLVIRRYILYFIEKLEKHKALLQGLKT